MRLCFIICTFLICYAGLGLDFINQITGTITGSIINIAQTKNVIDTITGENRQQNNYRTNRPYYNNYDDDENDEYIYIEQTKRKNNTQSRSMTRNHRRLKQQKKIKINNFFPAKSIINVSIDDRGQRAAIARNDGTVGIKNLTGENYTKTIQAEIFGGIKSMHFVGDNYVLYTCVDTQHNKHIMQLDIKNGEYKDITPINNCKHAHIYVNNQCVIMLSSNNQTTYLHQINIFTNTLNLKEILKTPHAISQVILSPNTTSFIYILTEKNGVKKCMLYKQNQQDKLIQTSGKNDIYISLDKDEVAYKISNNFLSSVSLDGGTKSLSKIQDIENTSINLSCEGKPLFITRKKETNSHISLLKNFKINKKDINTNTLLNSISNYFKNYNWERIDTSKCGRYWLLKITNPMQYTKYVIIDICNIKNSTQICSNTRNPKIVIHKVSKINIPVTQNRSVSAFVTYPQQYNKDTPVMLFLRRSNASYFSAQFDFMSQFLADRGYLVIQANQDCDSKNMQTNTDINRILNCLQNGWTTKQYRIYRTNLNKIMLVSFCKDVNNFYKCTEQNDSPIQQLACLCFVNPKGKIRNNINIPTLILLHNNVSDPFKKLFNKAKISIFSIGNNNATWAAILTRFMSQSMTIHWYKENVNFDDIKIFSDGLYLMQ